jgi:hypothetical protein
MTISKRIKVFKDWLTKLILLIKEWLMCCATKLREFLTRNKIFFETVAAFLLSAMAILLSYLQWHVTNNQTDLIKIQTNLSKSQTQVVEQELIQNRRERAISKAKAWTDLNKSLKLIRYKFTPNMVGRELPGLKNYTYRERLKWLTNLESLIYPLGSNTVLIESKHNYERFLSILTELDMEIRLIREGDPLPDLFYKVAERIYLHVMNMWIDLGMFRNSYAPNDSIFNPTNPKESIFETGFPWEIDIRNNVDTLNSKKFE